MNSLPQEVQLAPWVKCWNELQKSAQFLNIPESHLDYKQPLSDVPCSTQKFLVDGNQLLIIEFEQHFSTELQ